ncbi:hypothetical protein H2200_007457 [Cladophialophora chaetospira]|uniref:Uncharacterized protein n=1 Tax=Cladophialophora chaetospira TaxID=386627 RepID=A0AA38X7Z2_9EURO|nr:hypothetical protein H2200_007457 [Cladophialophora chaetospira]
MLVNAIGVVVGAVWFLAPSVLSASSSNSSQNIIPNAAGDTALDVAKVNKYKSLLDVAGSSNSPSKFNEAFKWTDILDGYTPLSSPGGRARPDPPGQSSVLEAGAETGDSDTQQSLLDNIQSLNPRTRIWGRPNHPLACPCFCAPTCPRWIQTICCTTPGSPGGAHSTNTVQAPKTHETLALITDTAHGDPVSVLGAVNLTVFDSFVTVNLVQGLERGEEIVYNKELKTFEITLNLVVGPQGNEVILAQTFVVVDGSILLEEEQILLGSGFLTRAGLVNVGKKDLTSLQEGLPVVTGLDV